MPKRKSSSSYNSDSSSSSSNFQQAQQHQPKKQTRVKKIPKSCYSCHRRKVRCDSEVPACSACKRHAKTLGLDPLTVVCEYATTSAPRIITNSTSILGGGSEILTEVSAQTIKRSKSKRKGRKKVIVERASSDDEEEEFIGDDVEEDDGIVEGMGTGRDLRREPIAAVSSSSSSTLRNRATPPPYLSIALPPRRDPLSVSGSPITTSNRLAELQRSPSPSTEENPIFFPPAQPFYNASPTSTPSQTPLPTPIETQEFNFPPTPSGEVIQQPYDSLDFLPDNPSSGGRSRSGTIMFTPSLSGLVTSENGGMPLWAT